LAVGGAMVAFAAHHVFPSKIAAKAARQPSMSNQQYQMPTASGMQGSGRSKYTVETHCQNTQSRHTVKTFHQDANHLVVGYIHGSQGEGRHAHAMCEDGT